MFTRVHLYFLLLASRSLGTSGSIQHPLRGTNITGTSNINSKTSVTSHLVLPFPTCKPSYEMQEQQQPTVMDYFDSSDFETHIRTLMAHHHVPGLSVAIIQDGTTISRGFGSAVVASSQDASVERKDEAEGKGEAEVPCTPDTLFDIASSSKVFTATAVALLVENKQQFPEVKWDAKMVDLLPGDFEMGEGGSTAEVRVDDVLSHQTGLAPHINSCLSQRSKTPDTARSITRNLRNLAVIAPVRSKYIYNNIMYTVATHLIESKTSLTFPNFLQTHLFQPLGMSSSTLQPSNAIARGFAARIASGYLWKKSPSEGAYRPLASQDTPESQGAGSILTSANDLIAFVGALLTRKSPITDGVYQGITRIRTIVNAYTSPKHAKKFTSPTFYGAGVDVWFYRGYMVVGHNGVTSGFASRFLFVPEIGFGAVILGNAEGAGAVCSVLGRELVDRALGVEVEPVLSVVKTEKKSKEVKKKDKKEKKVEVVERVKTEHDRVEDTINGDVKSHQHQHQQQQRRQPLKISPDALDLQHSEPSKPKKESKTQNIPKKTLQQPQKTKPPKKEHPLQETPLEAYTGTYNNPGYHTLAVEIKDGKLFIDATDRTMGFTLEFEHVSDQTTYTAWLVDRLEGGRDAIPAEFVFGESKGAGGGERAVRMGLELEDMMKEKIWFDRTVE